MLTGTLDGKSESNSCPEPSLFRPVPKKEQEAQGNGGMQLSVKLRHMPTRMVPLCKWYTAIMPVRMRWVTTCNQFLVLSKGPSLFEFSSYSKNKNVDSTSSHIRKCIGWDCSIGLL